VTPEDKGSAVRRAVNAGWELGAAGIHWGRRPAVMKPVAVTERDRRLLALLYDVKYLSSSQLTLLGWGGDSSCSRRRLRLLHAHGLIDKFRPARAAGSYEWNYRLTMEGWCVLAEHGMAASDAKHYKPADIHNIAYVEHDLQVNALVLDIAHRARAGKGPLLDRMPFEWHGPRRGEIDLREERRPERGEPSARLPPFFYHGGSREGVIKPDATLVFGGQERRQAVLLEYDRTARPHKQIARLRRYDWFLTDGWTHGRFAFHPVVPLLVFVTLHERTLPALVRAADEVLSATRGWPDTEGRGRVYVGRECVLFTTRERILSGDFRMLRAPSDPPERRKRSEIDPHAPFYTNEVELDLVALAAQPPDDALAA
jgi:hypothetical protein